MINKTQINSLDELKEVIYSLPDVKSVTVPTVPTGFYTSEIKIYSTQDNWKQLIVDVCEKVESESKKPIKKYIFRGYYGEFPKEGNEYYILLLNEDGIHTANMLFSGQYGSLD